MPWLTPIVFKQGPDEPLTKLPLFGDGPKSVRFRHIIHVYDDKVVPENTAILPITFGTVERARQFAAPEYQVDCVGVTFPEDAWLVPAGVITAPPLQRDVSAVAKFAVPRHLPLAFDILYRGLSASIPTKLGSADEVDFVVMTNADIHLQPTFYRVLAELIAQGYDVITANRRTIDISLHGRAFSPLFWAERGKDHPGLDCFVFPARMMEDFVPSDSCCGAGFVMRGLLFDLVAHARRFLMLTHAQMTFHLGDDMFWAAPKFEDYVHFNIAQAQSVISALAKDPEKAERLRAFITAHEMGVFRNAL